MDKIITDFQILENNFIKQNIFSLIKTDHNCHYKAKTNTHTHCKCELCKILHDNFKYNDEIILRDIIFNKITYIIVGNNLDSTYVETSNNFIISDKIQNYITLYFILKNNNINVTPIISSTNCNNYNVTIKQKLNYNWIDVDLNMPNFYNFLENLSNLNFTCFELKADLFKLDEQNKLYLNNYKNSSIIYNNKLYAHLPKFINHIHNNNVFLDLGNGYFKFSEISNKNYNIHIINLLMIINVIKNNYIKILQIYVYLIYYYLHQKTKYNSIIWKKEEEKTALKLFNEIEEINIYNILYFLSNFSLNINILNLLKKN